MRTGCRWAKLKGLLCDAVHAGRVAVLALAQLGLVLPNIGNDASWPVHVDNSLPTLPSINVQLSTNQTASPTCPETLRWLICHLDAVLQHADWEGWTWVAGKPQPEATMTLALCYLLLTEKL